MSRKATLRVVGGSSFLLGAALNVLHHFAILPPNYRLLGFAFVFFGFDLWRRSFLSPDELASSDGIPEPRAMRIVAFAFLIFVIGALVYVVGALLMALAN